MTFNNFLQFETASKYVIPDCDHLSVVHYKYDYFIIKTDGISSFRLLLNLETISYVLKVLSSVFGKDNHSYKCWSFVFRSAKSIYKSVK